MVGWHQWLNGHGFGWTPGVGDGQGGLVCCGSWGRKELDMTEWLNWITELNNTEQSWNRSQGIKVWAVGRPSCGLSGQNTLDSYRGHGSLKLSVAHLGRNTECPILNFLLLPRISCPGTLISQISWRLPKYNVQVLSLDLLLLWV